MEGPTNTAVNMTYHEDSYSRVPLRPGGFFCKWHGSFVAATHHIYYMRCKALESISVWLLASAHI